MLGWDLSIRWVIFIDLKSGFLGIKFCWSRDRTVREV